MSARTEYVNRLNNRKRSLDQLKRQDDHAVSYRTAVFCAGALAVWVVFGGWGVPWQFLFVPVALFIAGVIYHERVRRKQLAVKRSIEYYQRCLQRLDDKWHGIGPDGGEFADALHPYSGDLDLFSVGSLFQLLNSPVTPSGTLTLANWLAPNPVTEQPPIENVLARQEAVRSLGDQLDLREQLAAIGPTEQSQADALQLKKWLSSPGGLTPSWILVVGGLLGTVGVAALAYWLTTGFIAPLLLIVLVQSGFVYLLRQPLFAIKKHSEQAFLELQRIFNVVQALENLEGKDTEIRRLRNELTTMGGLASSLIRKLERSVSQFESMQRNIAIAPLAFISMVGLFFACAIDRWRTSHGRHVERWFTAIGELEALLAFSQLHFENPNYCFPKLIESSPTLSVTQLSHPLLPSTEAIANDVELSDNCRMLLVSGSNMSGKSTLLRSVGINTALAWAGAPVCAHKFEVSRLQVAAAMRIQDSLQTGTSHFFAELKRIQLIVELAKGSGNQTVLFLLDEILHGTNSHDRLVGARGVIDSLLKTGAIGLVTTHDLALSDIVAELETPTKNVHFRDEWVDGRMTFDYQMREGVVPKSNALSLMRLLGLDV